jgi:hypothetical protein
MSCAGERGVRQTCPIEANQKVLYKRLDFTKGAEYYWFVLLTSGEAIIVYY